MPVGKGATKVRFLTRVSYGFKHDTPGFEGVAGEDGKRETTSRTFEEGEEFEFPAEEHDVVASLIENGHAVRA